MTAPDVIWFLGSDSDLPHVEGGFKQLRDLGISFEVRILSAHRTPDQVGQVASGAREAGTKVLIGVAGGAAHLAGVLASMTTLPVIAVPIPTEFAGGLDSLLSMVQMPSGIPVATVAANKAGGKNAALLAARIMSVSDGAVAARLDEHKQGMAEAVLAKDKKVRSKYASN
ncbi:MAG: N5-carboxyaminoimidazole ribonucleotide mutase [Planctomycetota bacterium]|nr:MAG: N5-carboxyaminoimidazole ribonucleotide mutase [Planctomycetota bacterium]